MAFVASQWTIESPCSYVYFIDIAFCSWGFDAVSCLAVCVGCSLIGEDAFVALFDVVAVDAGSVVFGCETHCAISILSEVPCVAVYSVGRAARGLVAGLASNVQGALSWQV